jgi:phosphohistidine phosphatase
VSLVSPQPARRLVLMRHARAGYADTSDFDRPLAETGAEDARAAGRWLAELGVTAEAALVSAAVRAARTYTALASGAGWTVEPALDRALYHADDQSALDLIRLVDPEVRHLVVVGHNPTIATLAQLLDDGEGDPSALVAMASGFTPASTAVFDLDVAWGELDHGGATLTAYHLGSR